MTDCCPREQCACQDPDTVIALARDVFRREPSLPAIETARQRIHQQWTPVEERGGLLCNPT